MLFDPVPYSVTIGTIAFACFALLAIVRPNTAPKAEFSTFAQLPEPTRPIALLPAAPPLPSTVTANPHEVIESSPGPTAEEATIATVPRLPDNPESPDSCAEPPLLYPTAIATARDYSTIPSPWDIASDYFWGQNPTVTYPNPVGLLPGGAA